MTVKEVLNYDRIVKIIIDEMKYIDVKVRFRFLQMAHQFQPIVKNYNTIREEKITQYGSTHANGQFGIIKPDKDSYENEADYQKAVQDYDVVFKKFTSELNELLESDAKIEIQRFKPEEIMDSGIPADIMLELYDLIEQ